MRHILPCLDIRLWRRNPSVFAEELRKACHQTGFFTLKHDISPTLVQNQILEAKQFFARPLDEKRSISYEQSPAFRGYMSVGVENTAGKPDLREQIEIGPEGDPAAANSWPSHQRLVGPNQWPALQPSLRDSVSQYAREMIRLSQDLQEAFCLSLGLERDGLRFLFSEAPHWQLKMACTSINKNDDDNEQSFGVGAHTDTGFLTLLLQDEIGGLQVFTNNAWIDIPPAGPHSFVCNIGELAQMLTQNYFLATPHRVVNKAGAKRRISVPFFYNPPLSAKVEPLDLTCLAWERQVDDKQHWKRSDNHMLESYGDNAFKSLARSHPAVFSRHHHDLRLLEDGRVERL
mmetsp:Transcript_50162/g.60351  ORF Transcript_50162/g.60351 Transcript_50162/m.60351 type:complete len:345 (-) Transcript_50162:133-1167(-)